MHERMAIIGQTSAQWLPFHSGIVILLNLFTMIITLTSSTVVLNLHSKKHKPFPSWAENLVLHHAAGMLGTVFLQQTFILPRFLLFSDRFNVHVHTSVFRLFVHRNANSL